MTKVQRDAVTARFTVTGCPSASFAFTSAPLPTGTPNAAARPPLLVGQEGEVQLLGLLEQLVRLDRVAADAHDLDALVGEPVHGVAEILGLSRASGREVAAKLATLPVFKNESRPPPRSRYPRDFFLDLNI